MPLPAATTLCFSIAPAVRSKAASTTLAVQGCCSVSFSRTPGSTVVGSGVLRLVKRKCCRCRRRLQVGGDHDSAGKDTPCEANDDDDDAAAGAIETPTPALALYARGRFVVPYISDDLLHMLPPSIKIAHLCIESASDIMMRVDEKAAPASDSKLALFRNYITLMAAQDFHFDAHAPNVTAGDSFISARTGSGILRLTPRDYARMISTWRPDLAAPLRAPLVGRSQKNMLRKVTRDKALDSSLETELDTKTTDNGGYAFRGCCNGSNVAVECLRMAAPGGGPCTPDAIVRVLVAAHPGTTATAVHAITSKHAFEAAAAACALRLSFASAPESCDLVDIKDKALHAGVGAVLDVLCGCPVCDGAQLGYSRGYLHHLADAGEMSVHTLLAIHNVWQLERFVAEIRQSDAASFPALAAAFEVAYAANVAPKHTLVYSS